MDIQKDTKRVRTVVIPLSARQARARGLTRSSSSAGGGSGSERSRSSWGVNDTATSAALWAEAKAAGGSDATEATEAAEPPLEPKDGDCESDVDPFLSVSIAPTAPVTVPIAAVFVDGACKKNGTPDACAAWAFSLQIRGVEKLCGSSALSALELHTNNRGEMHAILQVFVFLALAKEKGLTLP